ncbi:acyltransferase family protein [Massilia glaciei]|uniref:Acyltransferase n=1 Tax=Massilia glaciei TaxID=1524097 RepID=A0A2U2HMF7_9BURK|nr:acyltransferase [Massilia glaciei]PWF48659.1 acyltransferase [Massilia glaciei]
MEWLAKRFELSRAGAGPNQRPMEGLRGLAVLLVFLVHSITLAGPWLGAAGAARALAHAVHTIGNSGVGLFFVFSGYLIYGSLMRRPQPYLRFLSRRAGRIYPAFLAVFALYLALSLLLPGQSKIPAAPPAAVLYLAQKLLLLPGLFPIEPMIAVAWSLSYEVLYYLAMPALIAVARLRRRSARWRVWFFIGASGVGLLLCLRWGGPVRLAMFAGGILLHEAPLSPLAGAVKTGLLGAAFFVLCLACLGRPAGALARAFSWTPLRWLGNMSYSFCLLHGLALKAMFAGVAALVPAAPHGALPWLLLAAMLLASLSGAAALFVLVERPCSLAPPIPATPICTRR